MDAAQFMDALGRAAGGGTALDPAVIAKLLGGTARSTADRNDRGVEGLSNAAIVARLVIRLSASATPNRGSSGGLDKT
jgi:hypothetical protein